jgi:hypothetical protein
MRQGREQGRKEVRKEGLVGQIAGNFLLNARAMCSIALAR